MWLKSKAGSIMGVKGKGVSDLILLAQFHAFYFEEISTVFCEIYGDMCFYA